MSEKTDLSRISEQLKQLPSCVDPARYRYIASLIKKAEGKNEAVARRIEEKAGEAFLVYKKKHDTACQEARERIARTTSRCPQIAGQMEDLFEKGDFEGIRRLEKICFHENVPSPLSEVTSLLCQRSDADVAEAAVSFDELLVSQEEEILRSLDEKFPEAEGVRKEDRLQKTFRYFIDAFSKMNTEQAVLTAISSRPENAGPLNSHLLVAQSLKTMQQYSPAYLNRFIAYVEALLWIEQAGQPAKKPLDRKK